MVTSDAHPAESGYPLWSLKLMSTGSQHHDGCQQHIHTTANNNSEDNKYREADTIKKHWDEK